MSVSSVPSSSVPSSELSDAVGRLRAAGCVFAEDEAALIASTARDQAEASVMIDRRIAGLPLEHVLGWASFRGLRIAIDPGVFIPRRRTEFLVAEALRVTAPGAVVLDLGCGSGALGVAVAVERPVELYAADIELAAVRCAQRNLEPWRGAVFQSDLFSSLPTELRGRIDVLLANVPYVPTNEIRLLPPEARLYEPHVTLDGGPDGLATLRRLAAAAPEWLAPGGHVFVEMSEHQAPLARAVLADNGLTAHLTTDTHLAATVVVGTNPQA